MPLRLFRAGIPPSSKQTVSIRQHWKLQNLQLYTFCVSYAVVTCEIKSFQNYFSLCRRPSEIILFQRVETSLKLFRNYFTSALIIAVHEYFPACLFCR